MKQFRLLKKDEIECRVSRISEKGVVLLLYKTARTDADLLDEAITPIGWQNDFKIVDGVLYGGIGILTPVELSFPDGHSETKTEWVWKWDAGTESNTEAEKGRASDAFKRAGFKWGIGRELYSAPFTFIPAGKCNIKKSESGRLSCFDEFEVGAIDYDEQERICYLVILLKGTPVFEWGKPNNAEPSPYVPICEKCGRPILDGRKRGGEPWAAADIASYTKRKFGAALCSLCASEAANAGTAD